MAKLIKKGSVSGLELQPDWTIEQDGFGLLTSRLTFRCDADKAANLAPKSGEAHKEDGRLKCHKSTWTINKSGLATVFSDYVGIETGDRTRIQIKGDIVTSTQPIQVHKDFLKVLKDLSADSSITATYYTSLKSEVNDGVNMVGKTFLKMAGMEDVVLPSGNQGISAFHDRFAMLTGLSYEKFAHLYKVNFSIRISPGGYHNKVYQKQN
jgi:hypothetical protein